MQPHTASKPTQRRPKAVPAIPVPDHRTTEARRLDLAADCLLQAGHHAAAEVAAWRAMTLRNSAR